jgi:hypothetical protein
MAKYYKTTYPSTLASSMDEIIIQGGTWEELVNECEKHARRLGFKPYSRGQLRGHVRWRQGEDSRYLGRYIMTDNGIEKIS